MFVRYGAGSNNIKTIGLSKVTKKNSTNKSMEKTQI